MRQSIALRSLLSALILCAPLAPVWAIDPSEVNIKVYEVWVSPNNDCSGATRIFSDANPASQNMVNGPTFGQGNVPDGTYPCVAMKMSDVITFKPATAIGTVCVPGTTYTLDLFRSDNGTAGTIGPDGTSITATGTNASPIEDKMYVYLSVTGTNSTGGPNKPADAFNLGAPFVVSGDRTGTFVTNFNGKVEDQSGMCGVQPPVFTFR